MTKEEIHKAAFDYLEANHSPSGVSEYQAAMNIAVLKAYTAAAQWASRTIIEKAVKWLYENRENVRTEDNGIAGWIPDELIMNFHQAMEE